MNNNYRLARLPNLNNRKKSFLEKMIDERPKLKPNLTKARSGIGIDFVIYHRKPLPSYIYVVVFSKRW